jgi:uncharacterized protein YyaL (SSP411 family)
MSSANALGRETSPYLRQHAENPVAWQPWGEAALKRAADEDRPLLVSIGYSACHWCHVMERESFEDDDVAALMNERFVCVKVDREERPDVDAIYMDACQAMTGSGGWPLNVFITPEQVPFYAGTYFPPQPRQGMPSWRQVLEAVGEAWDQRRDEIREQAGEIAERLSGGARLAASAQDLDPASIDDAAVALRQMFDSVNGGWGGAPKFPAASVIELLLRRGETRMTSYTLTAMASGGIYDQVGGGFSRYAVDETWTVPHFEKMLYDNALLARAYLHAWQTSGDSEHRRVVEETLDWALREMRGPEGGFYSAIDADSEGIEGKFYVWTTQELREALGPDAEHAITWFGAVNEGNFSDHHHPELTGLNVLEDRGPRPDDERRARIRETLLAVRERRVRPATDDKRLAAWNALMVAALADAGALLGRADYLDAARTATAFVLGEMRDARGRLLRTYNDGRAQLDGYLEDHAYWVEALVVLYEAGGDPAHLRAARELADILLAHFLDGENGGFFATADDADALLVRRKDLEDHPIPAGGSSAALGLLRLAALTGDARYEDAAVGQLKLLHEIAGRHPSAFAHFLQALDEHLRTPREVAIVGPPGAARDALVGVVRERPRPGLVLAVGDGAEAGDVALLQGRTAVDGAAAAYVCERFACRRPLTDPDELRTLLTAV